MQNLGKFIILAWLLLLPTSATATGADLTDEEKTSLGIKVEDAKVEDAKKRAEPARAKQPTKTEQTAKINQPDKTAGKKKKSGEEFPSLFSKDSDSPTHVTSDRLVTSNKARTLHFIGTVKAIHEGVTITCDEMLVLSSEEEGGGMEKLDAMGRAKVVTKTRVITGDKVELYDIEKKMVVTGHATLVEDGNDIAGEKIVYFYAKDDIIISGGKQQRVNMIITPKKKSEESSGGAALQ